MYCEVFGHRVLIHTAVGCYEYPGALDVLEEQLGGSFFRCHRSFLVNMPQFREKDYGTGLKNIRRTVKKYKGTIEAKRSHGRFSLSAALCLESSGKEERPSGKGE